MSVLKIEIDVTSVQKAEKTADKAFSGIESAVEHLSKSVDSLEGNLKSSITAFGKLGSSVAKPKTETMALEKAISLLDSGLVDLKKGLISAEEYSLKYANALSRVRRAAREGAVANDDLVKKLTEVTKATTQATNKTSAMTGVLKTVKAAAIGYATVLATMEIQEFTSGIKEQLIQIDSLERTYKAITGTTQTAAKEMSYISNLADKYGLSLTTLEDGYKGVLASTKNTTLAGNAARNMFTAVTKAAAVLGMSMDDTQGTLRALTQMISKGNVQAEELRGQLGKRCLPRINLLNCGKIFGKLVNFLKKGLDYSSNLCYCY